MRRPDLTTKLTRIGIMFAARPARSSPDLEALLLDVARHCPAHPRWFTLTISWLCRYEAMVARHRLQGMVERETDVRVIATVGLMLDSARKITGTDYFDRVIRSCRPAKEAAPLFDTMRKNQRMVRLAKDEASAISKRWKLWAQPIEPRFDALRPLSWIIQRNPSYQLRALFKGNLKSSILAMLIAHGGAVASESVLTDACAVTRKAAHDALDDLETCGLIERERTGRARCVRFLGVEPITRVA